MSAIFNTEFFDLEMPEPDKDGKPRKLKASTAKLVLLAIADHANDAGESAYPGLTLLEKKTSLSRQGVIDAISALKHNGILFVSDTPSRLHTNNYTLNLASFPCLGVGFEGSQATLLVKPLDYPSQATLPEVVKPLDLNHHITIKEPSPPAKKPKTPLRGIEAAIAMNRPLTDDDLLPETKANAETLERLAKGFRYNFPRFGENIKLDRVVKLIVKDGRDIDTFIAWAKDHKRDPLWYHKQPDTLWGDWPQAFAAAPEVEGYRTL